MECDDRPIWVTSSPLLVAPLPAAGIELVDEVHAGSRLGVVELPSVVSCVALLGNVPQVAVAPAVAQQLAGMLYRLLFALNTSSLLPTNVSPFITRSNWFALPLSGSCNAQ